MNARTLRAISRVISKDASRNLKGRAKKRRLVTARELKAIARQIDAVSTERRT